MIPRVPYGPEVAAGGEGICRQDTEFLMGHNENDRRRLQYRLVGGARPVMKKAGVPVVGVIVLGAGRRCRNEEPEGRVIEHGMIASNAYVNAIRL